MNEEKYFHNGRIEIGYELMSLHNIPEKKTYYVFTAIQKLTERGRMNLRAKTKFDEVKNKALKAKSAEEALDIIGYLYKKVPLIYKDSFDAGDKL